jgi:hypothetical protein
VHRGVSALAAAAAVLVAARAAAPAPAFCPEFFVHAAAGKAQGCGDNGKYNDFLYHFKLLFLSKPNI